MTWPSAATVLDRARALAPDDVELVLELARLPGRGRDVDGAVAAAGRERWTGDAQRVDRLRLLPPARRSPARARPRRRGAGRSRGGLPDRPAQAGPPPARRPRAPAPSGARSRRGDLQRERGATLRLARLLIEAGHEAERARPPGPLDRARSPRRRAAATSCATWTPRSSAGTAWSRPARGWSRSRRARRRSTPRMRLAEAAERPAWPPTRPPGPRDGPPGQPEAGDPRPAARASTSWPARSASWPALLLADAEHATDDERPLRSLPRRRPTCYVNQLGDTEAAVRAGAAGARAAARRSRRP